MKKNILFFGLVGFIFFWSCEKPQMVSEIPEIKFKSVSIENYIDTLQNEVKRVKLTISLVDGNGDIGLPENGYPGFESLDNKNLFITLFEKKEGEYIEVNLLAPHNYRTPYQVPEGQDKTLKADYEVTMDYSKAFFVYDTIKYSVFIYDRQKNKSNIVETPEIPASMIGIID
jgi:hypothetical protein